VKKIFSASLLLVLFMLNFPVVAHAADTDGQEAAPDRAPLKNPSALFAGRFFYDPNPPAAFPAETAQGRVTVQTTLKPELQQRLMAILSRTGPLIAAAVVLDAKTGAVFAMGNQATRAGASLLPEGAGNYCVYGGFPAASLVKIITAAVGLEKKGFDTGHLEPVSGRYHTLYRSQVGIERSPYKPEMVPLDKAFALSINPYFGKMWIDSFADSDFLDFGQELQFNKSLEFDLPVSKSRIIAPTNAFERAEVASGYNTRTTISPLHAALVAALPANGGRIMRPYIIDRIADANGKIIYSHVNRTLAQPLSPRSVAQLAELMQGTVHSGTARGSFAGINQLGAANGWIMGGKTGSIDLPEHTGRCDWFAGFGQSGQTSVAVACILIHGAQRTMRSSYVGAEMIRASLDPAGAYKLPAVKYVKKPVANKKPSVVVVQQTTKTSGQQASHPAKATKKRRAPAQNTGG